MDFISERHREENRLVRELGKQFGIGEIKCSYCERIIPNEKIIGCWDYDEQGEVICDECQINAEYSK